MAGAVLHGWTCIHAIVFFVGACCPCHLYLLYYLVVFTEESEALVAGAISVKTAKSGKTRVLINFGPFFQILFLFLGMFCLDSME